MPEKTLIPVAKTTADRIKELRIYKRETYDEVISRLLVLRERVKKEKPEILEQLNRDFMLRGIQNVVESESKSNVE
ncbi:MAG: DUF7557 family protein [Candidatus Heimdallarchaeaceae archaeon]